MNDPIFILVANGKPRAYDNFDEAVKMYLHNIDLSPNTYEYKGTANADRLKAEIDSVGKLIFYAFTNITAPTAIALYKAGEPYNEVDWFNMAAKENADNLKRINKMEVERKAANAKRDKNKVLSMGDFIELTDGKIGRIDVINGDTMQVVFDGIENTVYPMSGDGSVGLRSGIMGGLFAKPASFSLMSGGRKMGAYWVHGAGGNSQGNKRLDIYAQTNIWLINELEAVS